MVSIPEKLAVDYGGNSLIDAGRLILYITSYYFNNMTSIPSFLRKREPADFDMF
jgi:hypothetical protein